MGKRDTVVLLVLVALLIGWQVWLAFFSAPPVSVTAPEEAVTTPSREPLPQPERGGSWTEGKKPTGWFSELEGPNFSEFGFVRVPEGELHPGATIGDIERRAGGDKLKLDALVYEHWSRGRVRLAEYWIGKYEVTNAQWKLYLDQYRKEHTTRRGESLSSIAKLYSGHAGEARAIFVLNLVTICEALETNQRWEPRWGDRYALTPLGKRSIPRLELPAGLKLVVYAHRVPRPWYGWHPIAGLHSGIEWCDARKSPTLAFRVPNAKAVREMVQLDEDADLPPKFRSSRLRDSDFARYPVRDLSIGEILRFCEWAGCDLPSEYEWERSLRGDRANTEQYPFPGEWDRGVRQNVFAWADNRATQLGPRPVDDGGVKGGDGMFGTRHSIGNVWEPTRTFFKHHPYVTPEPPSHALYMFSLVAKGAAWGDGWFFCQISARAPQAGEAHLDIGQGHRAGSLGIRLVKHPRPGQDLLRHTILRMTLSANQNRQTWSSNFPPTAFALRHAAGIDEVHFQKFKSPYIPFRGRAKTIALAPLWTARLNADGKSAHDELTGKALSENVDVAFPLGVFRCDYPWRAWRRAPKGRSMPGKRLDMPEEQLGRWHLADMPAGEWFVVYWHGVIGFANKTLTMPPEAIVPPARFELVRGGRRDTTIKRRDGRVAIEFFPALRRAHPKRSAPTHRSGELWPLCETLEPGPRHVRPAKEVWRIRFRFKLSPSGGG